MTSFDEKIRALKAQGAPVPEGLSKPEASLDFEDTLSDLEIAQKNNRSPENNQIDSLLGTLTIEQAYKIFCPKPFFKKRAGSHEWLVSCPIPGHVDNDPSCEINDQLNIFKCFSGNHEATAGDVFTLAAANLPGFDIASYKQKENFPKLRRAMAEKMGYRVTKQAGKEILYREEPPAPTQPSAPAKPLTFAEMKAKAEAKAKGTAVFVPPDPVDLNVISISTAPSYEDPDIEADDISDEDRDFDYPALDWANILPPDTFLHEYMMATVHMQVAEEYNFWNGFIAVGAALGRETTIPGSPLPVFGNLFVCTVGPSGGGKTQAQYPLKDLLRQALPYDETNPGNKGIKMIPTPGSGEYLIAHFQREIPDPLNPAVTTNWPVKGLVNFSELSNMMSKIQRAGSTMEDCIIQFYDGLESITTGSLTLGTKEAVSPFCQMISTTQLKSIKHLLGEKDAASGFLNRWIFSMGPQKRRDLFQEQTYDLSDALDKLMGIIAWSSIVKVVKFHPKEKQATIDMWRKVGEPVKDADTQDMFVRLDLTFKKLILLLAANAQEEYVSMDTIESAGKIVEYLILTFKAIGARIGITKENEQGTKILAAIRGFEARYKLKNPGAPLKSPTINELRRVLPKQLSLKDLELQLRILQNLGIIDAQTPPAGHVGRPTVRYASVE